MEHLALDVHTWTGDTLEVLEVDAAELKAMRDQGARLVADLRRDAVYLTGPSVRHLVGGPVR